MYVAGASVRLLGGGGDAVGWLEEEEARGAGVAGEGLTQPQQHRAQVEQEAVGTVQLLHHRRRQLARPHLRSVCGERTSMMPTPQVTRHRRAGQKVLVSIEALSSLLVVSFYFGYLRKTLLKQKKKAEIVLAVTDGWLSFWLDISRDQWTQGSLALTMSG